MKKWSILIISAVFLSSCVSSMYLLQSSFRSVSQKVIPSVVQVNVITISTQQVPRRGGPWDFFFPNPEEGEDFQEKEFKMEGLGSGVIVKKQGDIYYVLTNNHVIGDGEEISITLYDKRLYAASLVGRDPRRDIALVSFTSDEEDIAVADIGDSEKLRVGDWAIAVGNPFGLDSTVTAGIISGLHRSGPTAISDFIQTDASINQGNSGGALINLKGEVVGINTWIQTPTGGNIGLGFAIPINSAIKSVGDFIAFGEARYGWLGVTLTNPTAAIIDEYGYSGRGGALITNVYRNSPGFISGLLPGDLVVRINNRPVESVDHMIYMLGEVAVDEPVQFDYYRQDSRGSVTVSLEVRLPDNEIRKMYSEVWPGFSVYPMDYEVLTQLELDSQTDGVYVINVEDRTVADDAGLMSGDIIQSINDKEVSSVSSFYSIINEAEADLTMKVLRDGSVQQINIPESGTAE